MGDKDFQDFQGDAFFFICQDFFYQSGHPTLKKDAYVPVKCYVTKQASCFMSKEWQAYNEAVNF